MEFEKTFSNIIINYKNPNRNIVYLHHLFEKLINTVYVFYIFVKHIYLSFFLFRIKVLY